MHMSGISLSQQYLVRHDKVQPDLFTLTAINSITHTLISPVYLNETEMNVEQSKEKVIIKLTEIILRINLNWNFKPKYPEIAAETESVAHMSGK